MKIEIKKGSMEEVLAERAVEIMGFKNTSDFVRQAIRAFYNQKLQEVFEQAGEWEASNKSDEERKQMSRLQGVAGA